MTDTSLATGIVFLLYLLAMLLPALYSGHKLRKSASFVSEYFLGSRNMASWLLAMSFAATTISGGTFVGFPSKIYSHGWILFLWIGSYMVFAIFAMGLMGKRLNQLARKTGAITVPDILRDRFQSSGLAVFGSLSIALFLTVNLVSQFKAGGLILDVLLTDTPGYTDTILPWVSRIPFLEAACIRLSPGYVASLFVFAVIVVLYTAYGGFRAVVWTDTLQGIVMIFGILILLPTVLSAAGGLPAATQELARRPASLTLGSYAADNALEYTARAPRQFELFVAHAPEFIPAAEIRVQIEAPSDRQRVVMVRVPADGVRSLVSARAVAQAVMEDPSARLLLEVRVKGREPVDAGAGAVTLTDGPQFLSSGKDRLFGPGRTRHGSPFHPLGLAISFFILWTFSGAGHPGFLVRLMAFRNSRDLRYAMATCTFYFALTYIPIVLIFVTAQVLVDPASLSGGPDSIMPTVAKRFAHPLLAGLLLAAPFSAVMSTVSSFLLVISSSIVRDIYQRTLRSKFSEKGTHVLSYFMTVATGAGVTYLALDPPEYLQDMVVLASEGLAATFLATTLLGVYWERMTRLGAWSAMVGGFAVMVASNLPPLLTRLGLLTDGRAIHYWGIDPFPISLVISFTLGILGSLASAPSHQGIIRFYFRKGEAKPAEPPSTSLPQE